MVDRHQTNPLRTSRFSSKPKKGSVVEAKSSYFTVVGPRLLATREINNQPIKDPSLSEHQYELGNDILGFLAELGSAILKITDNIDSIMQAIIAKASELLECDICYIIGFDIAANQAYLVASLGLSDNFPRTTFITLMQLRISSRHHDT